MDTKANDYYSWAIVLNKIVNNQFKAYAYPLRALRFVLIFIEFAKLGRFDLYVIGNYNLEE